MTNEEGCRYCGAPYSLMLAGAYVCTKAECIIMAFRQRKANLTALDRRSIRLKNTYGLTHNDYLVMLHEQGGVCAICKQPPAPNTHLAVDHDHSSGDIRGLLCRKCNLELGWYELNRRAVMAYLRRYKVIPPR